MDWWVVPCGFAKWLLDVGTRSGNNDVLDSFPRCKQRVCLLAQTLARPYGLHLLEQASNFEQAGLDGGSGS